MNSTTLEVSMNPARFYCSGLFPYTFEYPGVGNKPYQVVIGVFCELNTPKSVKQFFYAKNQLLAFIDQHAAVLDRESLAALTHVLNHCTLPFEAEYDGHMVGENHAETFLILANCLDKLPAMPPANPIHFLPL